ncbi:pre-rRNA-processing protein esf1 [Cornus florida]|uniref:pre-rRNA-processing protein esf1 n=1 Tax=Cornus florida TaxID=4283 RepID=UPI00289C0A3D|nr:pre-rRNA-processing protein esf1 [Cornus florida]
MGSKNKNSTKNKEANREAAVADGARDRGNRHGDKVITDPRFASVHSDPRFQKLPKRKTQVTIDSRFDRMFTDKSFSSSSAKIDKRGKPKKDSSQNPLKHYYRLEEEEDDKKRKGVAKNEEIESDEEISAETDSESEKLIKSDGESSDSELKIESERSESEDEGNKSDGSSTDTTTDSDEEDEVYTEEEDTIAQEENVPEIDKETHRLAIVNMDWSQVKAVDLYVVLSSFLPKGGQILSVAVYPSEFGLKRMEEEAVHGPVGLFDEDKEQSEDDNNDEIDNEKLRAYELSRLRYYYAVVECDSSATADYLYKTCDGVEFERSSNKLDLRFIPDSMDFKHPPRDVATEAPTSYEGLEFQTQALQQSKINLTWDEDEPHRTKTLKRKFNAEELAELELKEFLASDESETEEDENDNNDAMEDRFGKKQKKKDLYRALIQSGEGSEGDDDEDGQDMEVTFNTGLEDISKKILEKKDKKLETVWEAYLRKRSEKKKARKNRSKNSSEDESSDTDQEAPEQFDDFFAEEPSVKGSKESRGKKDRKEKRHKETADEAEASRAELELLLADDKGEDASLKGYNLKPKKAKGKKGKEIPDEGKIPTIDYDDPRFSALFTSPLYALDPTDPQFKRSAVYVRQLAQKQQKGGQEELEGKEPTKLRQALLPPDDLEADKNEHLRSDGLPSKKEKHELSSLVRSIKMKSKQVQLASNAKMPGKKRKPQSIAKGKNRRGNIQKKIVTDVFDISPSI